MSPSEAKRRNAHYAAERKRWRTAHPIVSVYTPTSADELCALLRRRKTGSLNSKKR